MQGELVTVGGNLFETITTPTFDHDGSKWVKTGETTSTGIYQRTQFRKELSASPVVRGNKKDPCPHSFSLKRECAPHGTYVRYVGATFPEPHTQRTEVSGYFSVSPYYDRCSYPISVPGYINDEASLNSAMTNARQKCLQKLWEEVRASEVNLGTTVGEGRESLVMLRNIAAHALKVKRNLILAAMRNEVLKSHGVRKKKKFPSSSQIRAAAGELPTTVAGLWLGWSVGLAPLISDCENIRNHSWTSHPLEFDVKARASDTRNFSGRTQDGIKSVYELCTLSERVQMGATFRIVDPEAWEVWRTGVQLRPTLGWELTTLSFVFDYFVQIGGYLQSLEAAVLNNGFEYVKGYETTSRRVDQHNTTRIDDSRSIDYTTKTEMSWGSAEMSRTIVSMDRVVRTTAPLPYRPVVKIPTASTALLNCAALLQLLFLSKR